MLYVINVPLNPFPGKPSLKKPPVYNLGQVCSPKRDHLKIKKIFWFSVRKMEIWDEENFKYKNYPTCN